MNFQDFLTDAETLAKVTQDIIIPEADLQMQENALIDRSGRALEVEPLAHEQIGARLNIPRRYYERMRTEQPELLSKNVNTWLGESDANRMIRIDESAPSCRAYVSDKFFRIDNFPILKSIVPHIDDSIRVQACDINSERMSIKFLTPRLEGAVAKGDIVRGGLFLRNSEVGRGTLTLQPFVERLVCLNGMILPSNLDVYSRRHITSRQEVGWLSQDTHRAELAVICSAVADAVQAGLSEEVFSKAIDLFISAEQRPVTITPKLVENLGKAYSLTEDETEGVLTRLLQTTVKPSAWSVANAVTALAHEAKSYDRATDLQAIGGRIVGMPGGQWESLAIAA